MRDGNCGTANRRRHPAQRDTSRHHLPLSPRHSQNLGSPFVPFLFPFLPLPSPNDEATPATWTPHDSPGGSAEIQRCFVFFRRRKAVTHCRRYRAWCRGPGGGLSLAKVRGKRAGAKPRRRNTHWLVRPSERRPRALWSTRARPRRSVLRMRRPLVDIWCPPHCASTRLGSLAPGPEPSRPRILSEHGPDGRSKVFVALITFGGDEE